MLFGGYDLETAFKHIAMAGYDGIELSAIDGMSQHLVLANWQELADDIKRFAKEYELELLAMEQPSRDPERMELAFQAAAEIGVPIINCGPGGASDDESKWPEVVDSLGNLSARAEHYGVTLCVKAHVGASIYNTPTTLRVMEEISSPAFGIDMDPSHIHRAGETLWRRSLLSFHVLSTYTSEIAKGRNGVPAPLNCRQTDVATSTSSAISGSYMKMGIRVH